MEKAGKIIKIFCTVALIAFLALLFFVMFQNSAKPLDDTYITESFKAAYEQNNDVRTHEIKDGFSENGGIYAYSLTYIPESGYLQFTVRYNERHIDEIKEQYPDFKNEYIKYVLVDGDGNEYEPNIIEEKDKYHYHYFKFEFTDVNFDTSELKIKMLLETLDFDGGELTIHTNTSTSIAYKFSSKEKKQLP
jgi:hypothetical protein